jgi:7,8-dihydropterin-6-yl-methyl-4-(beta-D-ribofuranosyl)aminobenzene 5'-phosphate synthase
MLSAFRLINEAKGGKKIPVHVNDEMFVHRGIRVSEEKVIPFEDLPAKSELGEAGGLIRSIPGEHALLDDMFYISGEIPRVTAYEKGLATHVKDVGNGWEPDPWIMDERYAAIHIKEKGILVFTACSHAGVVNVLKDTNAQLIGGFAHAAQS